jgi:hypothetical protein
MMEAGMAGRDSQADFLAFAGFLRFLAFHLASSSRNDLGMVFFGTLSSLLTALSNHSHSALLGTFEAGCGFIQPPS